jgi:hypothetical protein
MDNKYTFYRRFTSFKTVHEGDIIHTFPNVYIQGPMISRIRLKIAAVSYSW